MALVDLAQLAELPGIVQTLLERVRELESRLVVAERRPMTVKQAAAALGVSEKTVRRQIDAGKLQHQRTGARVVVYLPALASR
jgi:excisionase family DNA binding protein